MTEPNWNNYVQDVCGIKIWVNGKKNWVDYQKHDSWVIWVEYI